MPISNGSLVTMKSGKAVGTVMDKIDRVCLELSKVFTHLTAEQLSSEEA